MFRRPATSLAVAFLIALASASGGARAGEQAPDAAADIVMRALALLGTPYRYGGSSPEAGFDCSGLVRHVVGSVLNRDIPRRSEDMRVLGAPVTRAELQPGDLVFFNTLRRAFSHVAIYIGDGRFVHAPTRAGRVRIEGIDDRYWSARFDGARRIVAAPVVARPGRASERQPDVSAAVIVEQELARP